jgi:hypothetical protein
MQCRILLHFLQSKSLFFLIKIWDWIWSNFYFHHLIHILPLIHFLRQRSLVKPNLYFLWFERSFSINHSKKDEISINYNPGLQVTTLEASLLIWPKQQTDHSNENKNKKKFTYQVIFNFPERISNWYKNE